MKYEDGNVNVTLVTPVVGFPIPTFFPGSATWLMAGIRLQASSGLHLPLRIHYDTTTILS
jgi:hypothetical protein